MLSRYRRLRRARRRRRTASSPISGSTRLIVGFALIILVGTVLLRLPFATQGSAITWQDALFTATSAVTVTGLTLFSTADTFTRFGQIVILLLMQVGGVGFIALSVVLFRLAGREVVLQERIMLQQSLGVDETAGVYRMTIHVLSMVVGIELMGAALLFVRWVGELPLGEAAYLSLFHSISAFCNAGFDLFAGTDYPVMFGFGTDVWTLAVLSLLIIVGGLGIVVVDDLLTWRTSRLTLHTQVTLRMTLLLSVVGCVVIFSDERVGGTLFQGMALDDQLSTGIFTVVSARTAGITIVPLEQFSQASQLILMIWMFIGGAPSSMAGGVSMSTVAVLALAMRATASGSPQTIFLKRAIPTETIMKAMAVMTVSTMVVASATLILAFISPVTDDLFALGFEVVSAFSNTGYSLNTTAHLSPVGRLIVAFVMFWGRLGPMTLVVVLAQRQRSSYINYPDEKLIMG